jgi:hypothetical protein
VVRRDEEDGVRDGVLRGRARLHGEYMRWWWDAADGGDVKGRWDAGARELGRDDCRRD